MKAFPTSVAVPFIVSVCMNVCIQTLASSLCLLASVFSLCLSVSVHGCLCLFFSLFICFSSMCVCIFFLVVCAL